MFSSLQTHQHATNDDNYPPKTSKVIVPWDSKPAAEFGKIQNEVTAEDRPETNGAVGHFSRRIRRAAGEQPQSDIAGKSVYRPVLE